MLAGTMAWASAKALHMVSFEIFVKAMPPSLSELKVLPSFCFAFKIPDDVTASNQDEFIGPFLSEAVEASISYFFFFFFDETQMPKPPEATRLHNPRKLLTPSPFVSK